MLKILFFSIFLFFIHKTSAYSAEEIAPRRSVAQISIQCLVCQSAKNEKSSAVLLIHGLASSSKTWGESVKFIGELTQLDVFSVDYPSDIVSSSSPPLDELSVPLMEAIKHSELRDRKLIVIAHSQGGILALHMMLDHLGSHNVEKLILLASPLRGSNAARGFLASFLSKQVRQLEPNNQLLTNLRLDMKAYARHLPPILSISGSKDQYVNDESTYLEIGINKQVPADHLAFVDLSNPFVVMNIGQFLRNELRAEKNNDVAKARKVTVCIPELSAIKAYRRYKKVLYPSDQELIESGYFKLIEPVHQYYPNRLGTPDLIVPKLSTREMLFSLMQSDMLSIDRCVHVRPVTTTKTRDSSGKVSSQTVIGKDNCPAFNVGTPQSSNVDGIWIKLNKVTDFSNLTFNEILTKLQKENIEYRIQMVRNIRNEDGENLQTVDVDLSSFLAEFFRAVEIIPVESPGDSYELITTKSEAQLGDDNCAHLTDVKYGKYSRDLFEVYKNMKGIWDIDLYDIDFDSSSSKFELEVKVNDYVTDVVRHVPLNLLKTRIYSGPFINKK